MAGYVEMYRLGKTYDTPNGPAVIVEDFNLNMDKGEYVCLLGHSGCGKSTVLSMVAGLNDISNGGIVVANHEIDGPGPDRGVVFQSPCLMPWMTAIDNVLLGVDQVYPHGSKAQRRDIAGYYLTLVGLGSSLDKRAKDLSQGMQQRVGIARAFALKPKMLLLDEPFGMLDSLTRMELQEILLEILMRDKVTTLMITHDVDEALFMSDRVVIMTNGPRARVGKVLEIPFGRPRVRADVLDHPQYYDYRAEMIQFLEDQDHKKLKQDLQKRKAITESQPKEEGTVSL
ncbi:ABC transporter ATP-binding protein [Rubripirellula amarantea]|uniref:Bicarbonate transport ATP-binding protein CmpD n=1 Tax=Rubripirellula amarantea TaxID=2527999 RepID=A0A5C5WSB3_9BACT|nr:ABC transporter ATP-binding protein [Rubripirellula amarantea]MDA8744586.1 ABC transporter ATP-binding protein [Rubripirellula amarantea]TWT53049.1 Bicarbonate transport ATP-binding protein CmpD [Rubripirellula amarantea]